MSVTVLSWNLFHGRDAPPERRLLTWRSRLLRTTERGSHHAQVNRDLFEQFARVLRDADWDVALLQECPPRWAERLATECRAEPHLVHTGRNLPHLARLQGLIAELNPDLIASWEGGSNLTLVRAPRVDRAAVAERHMVQLTRRPERRVMALTRLAAGICIANLHASAPRGLAERDVPLAAQAAVAWADGTPLIFGGDLNVRPAKSRSVFATLERDHGLAAPTNETAIDHLLTNALDVESPPQQWSGPRRDVADPTAHPSSRILPIRLSDHAPVQATFALP